MEEWICARDAFAIFKRRLSVPEARRERTDSGLSKEEITEYLNFIGNNRKET